CRAHRHGRGVERRRDHRQPGCRLLGEPTIRVRIRTREPGNLRPGTLTIPIQADRLPILEEARYGRIREQVAQSVAGFESQLVILEHRVSLNEDVSHRMLVVPESRHRELTGHHAAAEPGIALQYDDLS